MIAVLVNGDAVHLAAESTLGPVLESLGVPAKGVAIAVNEEVVPRSQWGSAPLREGDRIEILVARQGG